MTRKKMFAKLTRAREELESVLFALGDPDMHEISEFGDLTCEDDEDMSNCDYTMGLVVVNRDLKNLENILGRVF